MANEEAGNSDSAVSCPMKRQRSRLNLSDVGKQEKIFPVLLPWLPEMVGHVYQNMLITGEKEVMGSLLNCMW